MVDLGALVDACTAAGAAAGSPAVVAIAVVFADGVGVRVAVVAGARGVLRGIHVDHGRVASPRRH